MDFFHKTIDDSIDAVKKNDFDRAVKILSTHLDYDHSVSSRLNEFLRAIAKYQSALINASSNVGSLRAIYNSGGKGDTEGYKKSALTYLLEAQDELRIMNSIVNELVKEELKLK